jgi:hypothetical protein
VTYLKEGEMTESFYRSSAPEVLTAWEELQERNRAYCEARDEWMRDFPGYEPVARVSRGGSKHLIGLSGAGAPGPLWVMKRGDIFWSPVLKTSAGKKLRDRLEGVRLDISAMPGMPHMVSSGLKLCWHSLETYGSAVWVCWSCPPEDVERCPSFSSALWERAPASAYHLAKEAHEAEQTRQAPSKPADLLLPNPGQLIESGVLGVLP